MQVVRHPEKAPGDSFCRLPGIRRKLPVAASACDKFTYEGGRSADTDKNVSSGNLSKIKEKERTKDYEKMG